MTDLHAAGPRAQRAGQRDRAHRRLGPRVAPGRGDWRVGAHGRCSICCLQKGWEKVKRGRGRRGGAAEGRSKADQRLLNGLSKADQRLVKGCSMAGQRPVKGWSKAAQWLVKGGSKAGQRRVKGWSKAAQWLVKGGSQAGQKLLNGWSKAGQRRVKGWSAPPGAEGAAPPGTDRGLLPACRRAGFARGADATPTWAGGRTGWEAPWDGATYVAARDTASCGVRIGMPRRVGPMEEACGGDSSASQGGSSLMEN
jgi:hypothetical protein